MQSALSREAQVPDRRIDVWDAIVRIQSHYRLSTGAAAQKLCEAWASGKVRFYPRPRFPDDCRGAIIDLDHGELVCRDEKSYALPQTSQADLDWWLENQWSDQQAPLAAPAEDLPPTDHTIACAEIAAGIAPSAPREVEPNATNPGVIAEAREGGDKAPLIKTGPARSGGEAPRPESGVASSSKRRRRYRNRDIPGLITEGVRLVQDGTENSANSAATMIANREWHQGSALASSKEALIEKIRKGIRAKSPQGSKAPNICPTISQACPK
jgi:hypothetical protein